MRPQSDHDRVFTAIRRYKYDHQGMAPTVRELAEATGIPLSSTQAILGKLEERGLIRRLSGAARTIQLPLESWNCEEEG